jgi:hypothetical protein
VDAHILPGHLRGAFRGEVSKLVPTNIVANEEISVVDDIDAAGTLLNTFIAERNIVAHGRLQSLHAANVCIYG